MEPTIKCGKQLAEHADLAGSTFHNVNLADASFDDVNLGGAQFENINLAQARFHDINFSDVHFSAAQMGGATFTHIGLPPPDAAQGVRQRPVTFEEATLVDSTFRKVDLSGVKLINCTLVGMTIDGILVTDLLAAYRKTPR